MLTRKVHFRKGKVKEFRWCKSRRKTVVTQTETGDVGESEGPQVGGEEVLGVDSVGIRKRR